MHDLSGGRPDLVLGNRVRGVHLAGRYVAWLDTGGASVHARIVVYDRRAEAVSYVIRGTPIQVLHGNLALQADGKIAFSYDRKPNDTHIRAEVFWASRSEPYPHHLALVARLTYFVKLAHDQVVFSRSRADSDSEVGVTDLDGNAELLPGRVPDTSDIDFNGASVAYAARVKHGVEIRTRPVP